jgi:glutamate racemase
MSKSRRFNSEKEIIAEIDRLKDDIPALYQKAETAELDCTHYFLENILNVELPSKVTLDEFKDLKRAAKRAAAAPNRQEKRIKKLSEALAEFRTERMPFLTDASVEVK